MKRIILFVLTNLAVLFTLGIVTNVLCMVLGTTLEAWIGVEYSTLAIFAFVYGVLGSFISLLLSKTIAKISCRAHVISGDEGEAERWLVATVRELALKANIGMPEVAIYEGPANAFATGAFRNHSLVAVSTDIISQMTKEELRAVLGHEMSHVANGDMVTMTLVQGVLNAFVIFFSRIIASAIANSGKEERNRSNSASYFLLVMGLQLVLGVLSSIIVCWYSRRREFAADKGSADLLGTPQPMIRALQRLGNLQPGVLPDSLKAMGITDKQRTSLFATHPSLESRIEALQRIMIG